MTKEKDLYQISLKVILKNSQGEILGLKAADNGSYAGYYDLPGGRIDTDEFTTNFADIIAREVTEEIGNITYSLQPKPVAVGRHLLPARMTEHKKDIPVLYLFFEAQYISGEIKISDEHTAPAWLDIQTINLGDFFKSGILEGITMYLNT